MNRLLLLLGMLLVANVVRTQTTYSVSPNSYACGSLDPGGDGIKLRILGDITNSVGQFRIRKHNENDDCSLGSGTGTFGTSGTMRLRVGSTSGTIVEDCQMSSCGGSTVIDFYHTFTHTSGTRKYYAQIDVAGFNYTAGPINVTASTPTEYLEYVNCLSTPSQVHMGEDINYSFSVDAVNAYWNGYLKVFLTHPTDANIFQLLSSIPMNDNPGGSDWNVNETDQVTLAPGNYRMVVFADELNSSSADDWVHSGGCTPTLTSGSGTTTHYRNVEVLPACPDLEVFSYSIANNQLYPGESLILNATIKNTGDGDAGSSTLYYYLDPSGGYSTPPINIGTDYVTSLSSGQTSSESFSASLEPDAPIGTYFVKWRADAEDDVDECQNENNNVEIESFSIIPIPGSQLALNASLNINPNPVVFNNTATFTADIANLSSGFWTGALRMEMLSSGGTIIGIIDTTYNLTIEHGSSNSFVFSHTSSMVQTAVGSYQLRLAYSDNGGTTWSPINEAIFDNPIPFCINNSGMNIDISTPQLNYAYPIYDMNGLFEDLQINWTSSGIPGNVNIEYEDLSDQSLEVISTNEVNDGSFLWNFDSTLVPGEYRIKMYPTGTCGAPFYGDDFIILSNPNLSTPVDNFNFNTVPTSITYNWVLNNPNGLADYEIRLKDITSGNVILDWVASQTESSHLHTYAYEAGHSYRWLVRANAGVNNQYIEAEAFEFNVQGGSGAALLQLDIPIQVNPLPLVHGEDGSILAKVINNGGSTWTDSLALQIIDIDAGTSENIIPTVMVSLSPGSSYSLLRPNSEIMSDTGDYEIRVQFYSNATGVWTTVDDGGFTNPLPIEIIDQVGSINITSPAGGETFLTGQLLSPIAWTTSGPIGSVTIELEQIPNPSNDPPRVIVPNTANQSPYNLYDIPACAVGDFEVKIYDPANPQNTVDNSNTFSIDLDPSTYFINVIYPNGGEIWDAGTPFPTITWNSSNNFGQVRLELEPENGTNYTIGEVTDDTGSYYPMTDIPTSIPQGQYKIKIYNVDCGSVVDVSNNYFTINSTYTGTCACTIDNPDPAQTEAYAAASYLCSNCIIDDPAAPDNDILPNEYIIKQDLAKITFAALFGDLGTPTYADDFPTPFFDMQSAVPYQRFGKVLSYLEYDDGISPFNRRFANYRPGSHLTRGEVCKVYCEAFDIPLNTTIDPYTDVDNDHPEHKYIAELAYRGVLNTNYSTFRPDDSATRMEAFIMLWKIIDPDECADCMDHAISATQANGQNADIYFFDPGNYTPKNLGRHPGFSDGNFDAYSATGIYMADVGMPLAFGHSYNSYLTELPTEFFPIRPLGRGWVHSYNSYIVKVPYDYSIGVGEDIIMVVWPDGSMHAYKDDGTSSPEKITEGNYDEITFNSSIDEYSIKKKNQTVFTFKKISGAHDAPYMLVKIEDRNNNKITINYEVHSYNDKSMARIDEVVGTTNRKLTFEYYGESDKLKKVNDVSLGRTLEFYLGNTSNPEDRLIWYKDAEQKMTDYNYGDDNGEYFMLKVITLPNGNFITNNYVDKKLTSTTTNNSSTSNPTQTNVNWGLNANVGASSTVSVNDGTTIRDYLYTTNDLGKITSIDAPTNDATIVYGDNDHPTLPTMITVAGLTTMYDYDDFGNVEKVTQEEGVIHEFEYNGNNDIKLYRNPRLFETSFIYGDGKNLTEVNAPIGSTDISYYPKGLVHTVTNPNGIIVSYDYDAYGNVKKMTAPESIESRATFDDGSRLKNFFNPNDQKMSYTYDNRNFITSVTNYLPNHPDYQELTTGYHYDNNGNLDEITNAHGKKTILEYDYFDLLENETFGSNTKGYQYDIEGKLIKITRPDGTELIHTYYQNEGLLKSDGYAQYGYDNINRLKTVTKDNKTITFYYDDLNRVTTVAYDGQSVGYDYDKNSNVVKMIYPGGYDVDYTYDANDRMKTVTDWNGNVTEYYYLLDGRLDYAALPNGVITKYFYDEAGRVDSISTTHGSTVICAYGFTLDKLGNHLIENKTEPFGTPSLSPLVEDDYNYNLNRNEILAGAGKTFIHDNNGNIQNVSGASTYNFTWDKHDMLKTVSDDFTASYDYDGFGHRRRAIRNSVETNYVLDILGMSRILIEQDAGGNDQNYFIYGLGLISRVKPNGDTRYFHYDFRGSTIAMTDGSAVITHEYSYDEFGAVHQMTEEDENRFRYVGGYGVMQEDDNILFMRARYYDLTLGRFLSEDPIWSDNLYSYGNRNPVSFFDPSGEITVNVEACGWLSFGVYIKYCRYDQLDLKTGDASYFYRSSIGLGTVDAGLSLLFGDRITQNTTDIEGGLSADVGEFGLGNTVTFDGSFNSNAHVSIAGGQLSMGQDGSTMGGISANVALVSAYVALNIGHVENIGSNGSIIDYGDFGGPGSIVPLPAPVILPKPQPTMSEYKPTRGRNYYSPAVWHVPTP